MNLNLRKQIRKIIFETLQRRKKILILVHPECLVETNSNIFPEYVDRIKNETLNFDRVFSYYYLPSNFLNNLIERKEESVRIAFEEMKKILTIGNATFERDYDMLETALKNEISEYLILNEGVDVYISGGNQDLCLREACGNFLTILKDEILEFNHSAKVYKPLVYHRRRRKGDEVIPGGLGTIYPSKKYIDFDLDSVENEGAWFEGDLDFFKKF